MTPEIGPQASGKKETKRFISPKRLITVGAAVIYLGFSLYQSYGKSGEVTSYGPIKEGNELIDDELVVLNWNMHNETSERYGEIKSIIDEHDVDAVALQEVSASDARGLHIYFPEAQVKFAMADAKTKVLAGGYGNVLMTFQQQRDTSSIAMEGNSPADAAVKIPAGVVMDVANFDMSFERTKDATQEDRTALASTIHVQVEDHLADVRIITGHIGSADPDVYSRQYDTLRGFVEDNISDDRGTVFCGDVNAKPSRVVPDYLESGMYVHETRRPTSASGATIDYCASRLGDVLKIGEVTVLDSHTDHYALLGTWTSSP